MTTYFRCNSKAYLLMTTVSILCCLLVLNTTSRGLSICQQAVNTSWLPRIHQQYHQRLNQSARSKTTAKCLDFGFRSILDDSKSVFPIGINKDAYQKYQFNVTKSNELPLDRDIPDTRPQGCHTIKYDRDMLPSVSIVIPFHNEAWSVLLRTLVSVIKRTPKKLLAEVILVDDASDYSYLKEPLRKYLERFVSRISIIRKDIREGLIIARMLGATKARGEVLVFLDAHVEVNVGWLEPLLDAINHDHRLIAVPNMDDINVNDFAYHKWPRNRQGGFTWTLNYEWKQASADKQGEQTSPIPFPTATTIGCAMAVNRKYFFKVGAYDEGMLIWGGENIEISFRNWMCGGSIYVFPCSRVGHIFRKYLPYSFPKKYGSSDVIKKNLQRVAEVWMDNYKEYYYASIHHREKFNYTEEISLDKRKALRQKLSCKSFSWYLKNIIPELPLPQDQPVFFGQLKSAILRRCLYRLDTHNNSFSLDSCNAYDTNSTFSLMAEGTLKLTTGECIIYDKRRTGLTYDACDITAQKGYWSFVTENVANFKANFPNRIVEMMPLGQLMFHNQAGHVCLASSPDVSYPYFMQCNSESLRQFWYFKYHFKYEFAQSGTL